MEIRRVLVIDDNVTARLATAEALNIHGLSVRSGGAAFLAEGALAEWEPVHLVVTGVSLPDQDGLLLAQKVARRLPGVPQILFAIDSQSLRLDALAAAGVVGLLSKNLMPAALRQAVQEVLGVRGA